jgi:hypothetical protein
VERSDGRIDSGRFDVFRVPLDDVTQSQRLFTFVGNHKHVEWANTNTSVSPDGQHVLYAYDEGVGLYDLASNASTLLLPEVNECAEPYECGSWFEPQWAPSGDWATVSRVYFEGGVGAFIRPLDPTITPILMDDGVGVGGLFASWSPDGAEICASESGYSNGSFVFRRAGEYIPADMGRGDKLDATDCRWGPQGDIAVRLALSGESVLRIFKPDRSTWTDLPLPRAYGGIAAWLPDESGIIVEQVQATNPIRTEHLVIMRQGAFFGFPYAADRVLAVVDPN